ncbi:MAG TPA: zinc dependent phospholipase C family protein [Desulfitobacteriaceae bacterium]|nr:zinc dependent phospholipase C family protein [Desulfitobacteriaceae bacterium]
MHEKIINNTLGKITKMLLTPVSPLQYFLDTPGVMHVHCLDQALHILECDRKEKISKFFTEHRISLEKGLFWADRGWLNVTHFYQKTGKQDNLQWPGAASIFQNYFNKSFSVFSKGSSKGMFYLGAALHLVQDMCVPHHSLGVLFDGHREFETWATLHWHEYKNTNGLYLSFEHPVQWINHNANSSAPLYSLVSLIEGCSEASYQKAAEILIPLTIATTAGFLDFAYYQLLYKQPFIVNCHVPIC